MQPKTRVPAALLEAEITDPVIGSFYTVYSDLGYGFNEPVYANALSVELQLRGLTFSREVPIEVVYQGVVVGNYRLDLVVRERVLVEVKSSKAITEMDERQIQNYLKASRIEVGLLLHFGPSPKVRRFLFTNDRKE